MPQFLISVEIDHEDAEWLLKVIEYHASFDNVGESRRVRDAIELALKEVEQ